MPEQFHNSSRALKALALALVVIFLSSVHAAAGVDFLVFDYDVKSDVTDKWMGPAYTDLTIKILNRNGKIRAVPRGDLRRMLHRRGAGEDRNFSMEQKEEYRSVMGAKYFVEGVFEERKGVIYFLGTYIDPESGEVGDISFESKAGKYEDIAEKFISKLSELNGVKEPLKFAAAAGTSSTEAFEKCWEGVYEYEFGDLKKAVKLLTDSSQLDPGYAEPLYVLGKIYIERADFVKAGELFQRAAKADPESHRAYFWLGFTAFLKADNFRAEENIIKALELYPGNPEYLYQAGMIFRKTFRYSEAVEKFKAAVDADPSIADAWYQLASIYAYMKRKDETLKHLKQAIKWGGDETVKKARNDGDFKWLAGDKDFLKLFQSHSGHGGK